MEYITILGRSQSTLPKVQIELFRCFVIGGKTGLPIFGGAKFRSTNQSVFGARVDWAFKELADASARSGSFDLFDIDWIISFLVYAFSNCCTAVQRWDQCSAKVY